MDYKNHKISFRVWGRQALFTDCIQPLNMRNIKTNRDWAGIFGNKRDEYR